MKRKAWIVVAIVFGVAVLTVLAMLGVYIFSPRSKVKYVAHRGYSDLYPDNTVDSFRAAAETTFYGIETDIYETTDGRFICNHDEEVKFADGSKARIDTSTFAELTAKPLLNTKTDKTVYLSTFEEYLEICKAGNKIAVIELKESCDEAKLARILAILDELYDRKQSSFISFDYGNLKRLRAIDPFLELQYLSETKNDPTFEECLRDRISIDVRQTILTKKMIKEFHAAGLTVNVWTVNRKFDLNVVRIKGVDYVTTNLFHEEDGKIKE